MRRRHSIRHELQHDLDEADQRITEHSFSSERVRRANALVEAKKVEDADPDEINSALEEQGLPRLEELGMTTAKELVGWWRLHDRKRKIERKLPGTEA